MGGADADPGGAGGAVYCRPTGQPSQQRLIGVFSTAGHGLPLSCFLDRYPGGEALFPGKLSGP